jgi:DNA processing protein
MTDRQAYILFNMMEGIGPVRVRSLIEALGSMQAVVEADEQELMRGKAVGPELARSIAKQRQTLDPAQEEATAEARGYRVVTFIDPGYPEPLKTIYDPPLALYIWGTLEAKDRHGMALIGSRRTSNYGRQVADRLAYQLARTGFTVNSGLARGIDTAAHEGAIKGGGRTLAVLGGALDKFYPPENRVLAEKIAEQGAVISEFPFGREPDRTTFPMRNRIVSGLSMGVVVVEAGIKSGALHTANAAAEQGRTIFAVPGRIDSAFSGGSHQLIKTGAKLVEDVDDILQEFEFLIPKKKQEMEQDLTMRPEVQLSAEEQAMVKALAPGEQDVDTLARLVELPAAKISALLIGLEMKRVIRMLPGRMVELTVGWKDTE